MLLMMLIKWRVKSTESESESQSDNSSSESKEEYELEECEVVDFNSGDSEDDLEEMTRWGVDDDDDRSQGHRSRNELELLLFTQRLQVNERA